MSHNTKHILMMRPACFSFNVQTSQSNAFQNNADLANNQNSLNQKALVEFDAAVALLKSKNIQVHVFEDTPEPVKPDAIFPNNWVSFHDSGKVILYPMCAPNRRLERRMDVIEQLKTQFSISELIDFSHYEAQDMFLEGTGSIVFDHINKLAYACLSKRTNIDILNKLCNEIQYKAISFDAVDAQNKAIYHTNVMMCLGKNFVVICFDSINDPKQKDTLKQSFAKTNHEIIDISLDQMNHFAGNMLEVLSKDKTSHLIMSESAKQSLSNHQLNQIKKHSQILALNIPTIETIGGGSARCMIAEIFLNPKHQ